MNRLQSQQFTPQSIPVGVENISEFAP